MNESFETPKEHFRFPNVEAERGEFERVANTLGVDADTLMFLAKEEGKLVSLGEDLWSVLGNTDSYFDPSTSDVWNTVKEVSESKERVRDWQKFRELEQTGDIVDAPIILKIDNEYHLVAGNTRLMVARGLGITPKVLMFEYTHDRTDETAT